MLKIRFRGFSNSKNLFVTGFLFHIETLLSLSMYLVHSVYEKVASWPESFFERSQDINTRNYQSIKHAPTLALADPGVGEAVQR